MARKDQRQVMREVQTLYSSLGPAQRKIVRLLSDLAVDYDVLAEPQEKGLVFYDNPRRKLVVVEKRGEKVTAFVPGSNTSVVVEVREYLKAGEEKPEAVCDENGESYTYGIYL